MKQEVCYTLSLHVVKLLLLVRRRAQYYYITNAGD